MKPNADIINETTARALLERWYDGTATTDDEDALTLYFTSSEVIPEDLKADAAIFALPAEQSPSMSEDIPADLMAQVNGAIIAEKSHKRRRTFWYTAASVAACACIALILGISENAELTPATGRTYANVAQKPQSDTYEARTITPSSIEEVIDNDITTETTAPTPAKPRYAQASKVYDDYHEVSDPAEAARIQRKVAALLSRSLNSTGKAAERAMLNADKMTEHINQSSAEAVAEIINNSISGL